MQSASAKEGLEQEDRGIASAAGTLDQIHARKNMKHRQRSMRYAARVRTEKKKKKEKKRKEKGPHTFLVRNECYVAPGISKMIAE